MRRVVIGVLVLIGVVGGAKANKLLISLSSISGNTNNSTFTIGHHTGATSAPGWGDIVFSNPSGPYDESLLIYENFSPSYDFMQDAREANNIDTIVSEIAGEDLIAPVESKIMVNITDFLGEENMLAKKVIGRLYDVNDANDPNDDFLVGTYDCWNMHESGQKVYLTVRNGSSHRWETTFYNTNLADFDNDSGHVDLGDFALLSIDWKKGTGNYLTDISGPAGLSDGVVDEFDLKVFAENWLAE